MDKSPNTSYAARLRSIDSEGSASDRTAVGTKSCCEKRSQNTNMICTKNVGAKKGTLYLYVMATAGMPCNTAYNATTYFGIGSCLQILAR